MDVCSGLQDINCQIHNETVTLQLTLQHQARNTKNEQKAKQEYEETK